MTRMLLWMGIGSVLVMTTWPYADLIGGGIVVWALIWYGVLTPPRRM